MNQETIKSIMEAVLFVANEPLSIADIKKVLRKKLEDKKEEASNEVEEENQEDLEAAEENQDSDAEASEESEDSNEDAKTLDADSSDKSEVQTEDQAEEVELEATEDKLEISNKLVKTLLQELIDEYDAQPHRAFELKQVAKGYQFRTKLEFAPYIRKLHKLPKPRFSAPAMETLAIIAYQQPVSRAKMEQIRGVDSGGVVKTLLERDLIRIVGRSEEAGKALLYGTTDLFLETFSLKSLKELPSLKELEELDQASSNETAALVQESLGDYDGSDVMELMDEESTQLIDDLENSMRHLKDLEKDIFEEKKEEAQSIVEADAKNNNNSEQNSESSNSEEKADQSKSSSS